MLLDHNFSLFITSLDPGDPGGPGYRSGTVNSVSLGDPVVPCSQGNLGSQGGPGRPCSPNGSRCPFIPCG